ncbi:MAG: hypothetical protein KF744_16420 [Taibaiella sp.]|nr:hypothetical protein [Taibaiella sp.]
MNEEVKKELEELKSPLAGSKIGMPFGGQQDYFAGMPEKIASIIAEEQTNAGLPMAVNPYVVPVGYFEELPARVLANAGRPARKGVTITFRQLRLAAAAVVLLVVGVGAFVRTTQMGTGISENAILANVADKDIRAYLGNAGAPLADASAGRYIDKIDVKAEDIEKYLDDNGWDTEMTF